MTPKTEDSIIADALTTYTQLIKRRDLDGALSHWRGVQDQLDGFTYWYNLGTLHVLRESYPEARFAFEKARHLTIYSRATEDQLGGLGEKLSIELPTEGASLGVSFSNLVLALGPFKLWLLVLLVMLVFLIVMKKSWSQLQRGIALSAAFIPAFTLAIFQWASLAFIVLQPIEIYEGPSRVFATGQSLSPGSRILARDRGEWIEMYDENGRSLWLPRQEVMLKAGVLWGAR